MRLKDSTVIPDIQPELTAALFVLDEIYREVAGREMVITSLRDGYHSLTSLHYAGAAADTRTRDLKPGEAEQIRDVARRLLGRDFDVILEATHLHVEWQPRRPLDLGGQA